MNEEVVPNRVVPVSAGGDRAAVHLWGDPQITGSSPVEVERGGDAEPGEWLGCEGGSQFEKGGFAGIAESPVMPTVPYEEGTGTSVAIAQTGHRDVILDEEGAGLYEMAGGGEGAPVLPAEKTRGSFHRENSGSEGGTCIPGSDTSAVLDYQSERVAFRGEESGVDGSQCSVRLGGLHGGGPLGPGATLLVPHRNFIIAIVEEEEGECDAAGGHLLNAGSERLPGRLQIEEGGRGVGAGEGDLNACTGICRVVRVRPDERIFRGRPGGKGVGESGLARATGLRGAAREKHAREGDGHHDRDSRRREMVGHTVTGWRRPGAMQGGNFLPEGQ